MITGRQLLREEIDKIWTIDRREVVENIYYFEDGRLVLKPEHYDVPDWPPEETERYTRLLVDCFERGGWFYGLFDGAVLFGVAILESKFIGNQKDQLQLEFLHISQPYRGKGYGKQLFDLSKVIARQRGAKRLYISATPSEHTINFYLRLGCTLTKDIDPELFAREPEDIHLECDL